MVNNVVLVGRLTAEPIQRQTQSGNAVVSFTIAVDDSRRGPNGEKVTIFMGVTVWGKPAENVAKFVHKGNLVGVVGKLTQRKFVRRDNVEVSVTEVNASSVEFMEPKGTGARADSGFVSDEPTAPSVAQPEPQAESQGLDSFDIVDDNLPF